MCLAGPYKSIRNVPLRHRDATKQARQVELTLGFVMLRVALHDSGGMCAFGLIARLGVELPG